MSRFLNWLKNTSVGLAVLASCVLIGVGVVIITRWFGILFAFIFNISIEVTYSAITNTARGTFGRHFMLGVLGWVVIALIVSIFQLATFIGEDING